MTRRIRRVTQWAAIAGSTLLVAVSRGAAAYPPPPPPLDLSHLEFAPALAGGAVPVGAQRAPEPTRPEAQKLDRTQLDKAVTEQLDVIQAEEQANGKYSTDLASELLSLAVLYQQRGDHILAIPASRGRGNYSLQRGALFAQSGTDGRARAREPRRAARR